MPKKFSDFCKSKAAPPDGGLPYKPKSAKNMKAKKELGDMGTQPAYTPGKTKAGKKAEQIKEGSFVDTTSRMNPKQFVQYMKKTTGNPALVHETAARASRVLKSNPGAARALVFEAKRTGVFNKLVIEMLQHDEFFETFAAAMGSRKRGSSVCRSLVRAMNEMVGPPAPGGDDSHQPPPLKASKHAPHGHGFGHGPEEDEDDEFGDDEFGGEDDGMFGDDEGEGDEGDEGEFGNDHGFDDDGMGGGDDMMGHDHPALGGNAMGHGGDDLDDLDLDDDGDVEDEDGEGEDDEESMEDMHKDDPDDDDHENDEEEEEGENPFKGKHPGRNPEPKGGGKPSFLDGPKPSLMSRMMRGEGHNPALSNFRKAFRTYNG